MLIIDRACLDGVLDHSRHGYPREVCGLLLGLEEGTDHDRGRRGRVAVAYRCENLETERATDRYEIDPRDLMRAEELAARRGLRIVGIYHSHPDHPAEASETDRDRAVEIWQDLPSWSYLIVEVAGGRPRSYRCWLLRDRRFEEEAIAVEPDTAQES